MSNPTTTAPNTTQPARAAIVNTKPVQVKLVLLGEAAVGKSSLVSRFVSNEFHENKEPTIGAAFLTRKCKLDDRHIKFEIWDTAGQERFHSLAPMYYRNAQAALVVYDITKSVSKLTHLIEYVVIFAFFLSNISLKIMPYYSDPIFHILPHQLIFI